MPQHTHKSEQYNGTCDTDTYKTRPHECAGVSPAIQFTETYKHTFIVSIGNSTGVAVYGQHINVQCT